jgi:uncharacterized membrane protein YphA (DoxX/SURF4 family)
VSIATVVLTIVLSIAYGAAGAAKVAAIAEMRRRADHLGYSVTSYRVIGAVELAGVAALLAGLAVPALAMVGAAGLACLMLGATASHLRAGDGMAGAAPAAVLGAATVALLILTIVAA